MALWDKLSGRGNVQDRRGISGAGMGIAGVVIVAAITLLSGGDLGDVLTNVVRSGATNQPTENAAQFEGLDTYEVFASTVLGSNNELWKSQFAQLNKTYTEPTMVLFRQATQSGCGLASSQSGPHYCPADETIYLDETFFDELTNRLGATGGDVAEAYVIAHEVGHHVQQLLGTTDRVRSGDNTASINMELQADCFAGMWAHSIRDQGVLEPNEIAEAMDAAAAVGDDRIQENTSGRVNSETWTHGSSSQRVQWFTRGYESGSLAQCNTFQ